MIITSIEVQKKDKDRFNLFADDEFLCGIGSDTLVKLGIYKGQSLNEEIVKQIIEEDIKASILNRVMRFLTRNDKTEKMALDHLKKTIYKKKLEYSESQLMQQYRVDLAEEQICKETIERVKELGFINDVDYAEGFIRSRIQNRPRAKKVLEMELKMRGVAKNDITEAFERIESEEVIDEFSMAMQLIKKKYGIEVISRKDQKVIRFLQSKGIDWDIISKLMKNDITE